VACEVLVFLIVVIRPNARHLLALVRLRLPERLPRSGASRPTPRHVSGHCEVIGSADYFSICRGGSVLRTPTGCEM